MDPLRLMGANLGELAEEYASVTAVLQGQCGLSDYQARAYMSLVAHSEASADEVAKVARIPRTSAYKALRALCALGWARSLAGRPEIFIPTKPSEMSTKLTAPIEEALSKVSRVEGMLSSRGTPQMVYTIYGRNRVLKKLVEIVDRATKTLIVATPKYSALRATLDKPLKNALRRGVDILVVTEPYQRVPPKARLQRRADLLVTDVIADGEIAILTSPDLEACGYTDNPQLAKHLEDFLKMLVG
jgi:sugar-specific transcriptional regulator TrmB